MIRKLVAVIVCVAFLSGAPPPMQASLEGARLAARVLFVRLVAEGWEVRDYASSGLLAQGDNVIIRTTLFEGRRYKLVAAGCEDAYDVDIRLYDENGNFISGDNDEQVLAVADVTPKWSGTYYVKVTMYRSTSNGAHYVLQYAYAAR
jgi:hypothetical protein